MNEVNLLGVTCLNGSARKRSRSFAAICGRSIRQLHALAPGLPIKLSEVSSGEAGGLDAAWIAEMFRFLAQHPWVTSVNWFNLNKETDWRLQSSQTAARQFALGARSARYN